MTEAEFEHLLAWLHPEREAAAQLYQSLHAQLAGHFTYKYHLPDASDELADRTLDRAANRLLRQPVPRQDKVFPYFSRCAHFICLEYLRERQPLDGQELDAEIPDPHDVRAINEKEINSQCLAECVRQLPPERERAFIAYYGVEKQTKAKDREALAAQLGCSINALRLLMMRLRDDLRTCVTNCQNRRAR